MVKRVDPVLDMIDGLSAIERPAAGLVALSRFAFHFGISHSELSRFIDHLWGVLHVTPETWVSWADEFDHMALLEPLEGYPVELMQTIPAGVAQDFSALVRAVFETSEATWYCSNCEGTRDALLTVIDLLNKHGVPGPDLTAFRLSRTIMEIHGGPSPPPKSSPHGRRWHWPNEVKEPTR